MSSTAIIYEALQAGADDDAINELIRAMLSTARRTADDHDVMSWRRDNYLDLRRWAYPPMETFAQAQANIAAGGVAAIEGEAALSLYYAARLTADLRFPANPYVPDPDPVDQPVPE
jgi:hypothetical protein